MQEMEKLIQLTCNFICREMFMKYFREKSRSRIAQTFSHCAAHFSYSKHFNFTCAQHLKSNYARVHSSCLQKEKYATKMTLFTLFLWHHLMTCFTQQESHKKRFSHRREVRQQSEVACDERAECEEIFLAIDRHSLPRLHSLINFFCA